MQTIQVNVLNPKAYKLLLDLADLKLISLDEKTEDNFVEEVSNFAESDLTNKKALFKQAFGAFESEKSAEEIIEDIRSSRIANRNIEQF